MSKLKKFVTDYGTDGTSALLEILAFNLKKEQRDSINEMAKELREAFTEYMELK